MKALRERETAKPPPKVGREQKNGSDANCWRLSEYAQKSQAEKVSGSTFVEKCPLEPILCQNMCGKESILTDDWEHRRTNIQAQTYSKTDI